MRFFLLKTLAFVFTLLFTLYIHFGKMYYANVEYPMWKAKKEYLLKNREGKNIIIGDSRLLAGISPNLIGNNFYNLALGGSTTIDGYYTLLQYLEHNQPKQIIVSYAPYHLHSDEAFYDRTLKFGFLNNSMLFDLFRVIKKEGQSINGQQRFASSYDYYTYCLRYFLALNECFLAFRADIKSLFYKDDKGAAYMHNKDIYREVINQEGQHYFGTNTYFEGLFNETNLSHFKVSPIIDIYLKKTIDLAMQHDIKVYYINAPFNEASARALKPDFVKEYHDYMKSLHALYPQVIWHSDLHYYPNDCFGDRFHLNHRGNSIFSRYVRDILEKQ